VGAGLLAKAACHPLLHALTQRIRQQAGSYSEFIVNQNPNAPNQSGRFCFYLPLEARSY